MVFFNFWSGGANFGINQGGGACCSLFDVAVAWLVVIGWVAGFSVVFGRALPVGLDGDAEVLVQLGNFRITSVLWVHRARRLTNSWPKRKKVGRKKGKTNNTDEAEIRHG